MEEECRKPLVGGLDASEIQQALGPDQPAYRARQLYEALYQQQVSRSRADHDPAGSPASGSGRGHHPSGFPKSTSVFDSIDGTRRYLLRLEDGKTVETVLMPEASATPSAFRRQVGCPVDCKFCMTALLGLERNLTAGEIVGQVLLVAREHGLRPDAAA